MRFNKFSFGSIQIDGSTYEHDVIVDRGEIRKRKKKPSKKFREQFGRKIQAAPGLGIVSGRDHAGWARSGTPCNENRSHGGSALRVKASEVIASLVLDDRDN